MRDPVVAFRMPDADRLLLEVEADREGVTVSEWVRRAIRDRLGREPRRAAPMTREMEAAR